MCIKVEQLDIVTKLNLKNKIDINIPKLIALCGKACTGKTTIAIKLAEYFSYNKNLPVVFFSLESSKESIINNLEHYNSNLFIVDTPGISANDIGKYLRNLKKEKDIKFVVIDYLQLVSYNVHKCSNFSDELENICKELKKLVVDLNIPILVTYHLPLKDKGIIEDNEKLKDIDEKIFLNFNRTLYC